MLLFLKLQGFLNCARFQEECKDCGCDAAALPDTKQSGLQILWSSGAAPPLSAIQMQCDHECNTVTASSSSQWPLAVLQLKVPPQPRKHFPIEQHYITDTCKTV